MRVVVSQPYDRIDSDLQDEYYNLSPYNVVRIIRGKTEAGDQPTNPPAPTSTRAPSIYFRQWLAEGVLVREDRPSLLRLRADFHGRRPAVYPARH